MFYNHFVARNSDTRDDAFLLAFVAMFQRHGLTVVPATYFAPELLVKPGNLTESTITASQQRDIDFGWELAKCMGGLDVGQTVVVKDRAVLAVEAIEGTDALLGRCQDLKREGQGGVLVKLKKTQQERRADLPTIGADTVRHAAEAGLNGIAVEAGQSLILDRAEVVAEANRLGLYVTGIKA